MDTELTFQVTTEADGTRTISTPMRDLPKYMPLFKPSDSDSSLQYIDVATSVLKFMMSRGFEDVFDLITPANIMTLRWIIAGDPQNYHNPKMPIAVRALESYGELTSYNILSSIHSLTENKF
jgi:hypothetical protein